MKPVKYKLIREKDPSNFEAKINQLLSEGYVFYGEVKYYVDEFVVSMVKMVLVTESISGEK